MSGPWPARRSWRWGAVAVVAVFALSRLAAAAAGVRFDAGPLRAGFQVLELSQLRDDLVGSLANLHSQPPLFNLFIGVVLRAPEALEEPLLRIVYLAMGVALSLAMYTVLVRLGVRSAVAAGLALVVALSPASILFENWAHYDYPVTVVVCLAVLALQRYEHRHRQRDLVMFLGLLGVLVLTRSTFQLLWYLGWVAVLVIHRRHADWKRVAAVAAVPLIAIVAVYANIWRIAGTFTSSTSLGVSLAKITTFQLPESERSALVARGQLSPLALVPPFTPVPGYAGLVPAPSPTGEPVLDDEVKTFDDGTTWINFNNLSYVEVSDAYLADAVRTVRLRPGAYFRGVATAMETFFRPPSDFFALSANRAQLDGFATLYNRAVEGVVASAEPESGFPDVGRQYRRGPARTAVLWVLLYAFAVVGGAWTLWSAGRRDRSGSPLLLLFLWANVVYLVAVGNLVEVGENERFRLYSDPLVVLLAAAVVVNWRHRHRGTETDPQVRSGQIEAGRLGSTA